MSIAAPPPAPAPLPAAAAAPVYTPPAGPSIYLERASRWYGQVIGLNDVSCHLGPGLTALLGRTGRQIHAAQTYHRATETNDRPRSRVRHGPVRQHARCPHAGLLPRN
jgi:hypothetical protein